MKLMLSGIMLVLVSLFLMMICVLNSNGGGFFPDVFGIITFISGVILFLIGLFDK